jgi:hypothetical protein
VADSAGSSKRVVFIGFFLKRGAGVKFFFFFMCVVFGFGPVALAQDYVLVRLSNLNQLPRPIQAALPGQDFERPKGQVTFVVGLPNDDKFMGLWGVLFKRDGDDFGETHGLNLETTYTTPSGTTLTAGYFGHLFTQNLGERIPDSGRLYKQAYVNESVLRFMVDNIRKENPIYYKAAAGWIELNSKNAGELLSGVNIQDSWHRLIRAYRFQSVAPPGPLLQSTGTLELFFGWQKFVSTCPNEMCRVRGFVEGGRRQAGLDASFWQGSTGAKIFLQKPGAKTTWMMGGKVAATRHSMGEVYHPQIDLGVARGRLSLEAEYAQGIGTLHNYQRLNERNKFGTIDPIVTLKARISLGRRR